MCLLTVLLLPCVLSLTQNLDIMMLIDYAIPLMNVSKILLSIYSRYAAEIVLGFQEFPMLLHYIPHPYVDANSIFVSLVSFLRMSSANQSYVARSLNHVDVGMRRILPTSLRWRS